jgi:hypothetical protein
METYAIPFLGTFQTQAIIESLRNYTYIFVQDTSAQCKRPVLQAIAEEDCQGEDVSVGIAQSPDAHSNDFAKEAGPILSGNDEELAGEVSSGFFCEVHRGHLANASTWTCRMLQVAPM